MSQQTQPQQKQPESLRRGVPSANANIIARSNIQTNAALVSSERNVSNDHSDYDFYETNYLYK